MTFKRVTHSHTQTNNAKPDKVFPLLCPVKEKEWLDDWSYDMIYSNSGFAEQECVFQTEVNGKKITWMITVYEPENYRIEFVRTDNETLICHISIKLNEFEENKTRAQVRYSYTALNEEGNTFVENYSTDEYLDMMEFWEDSINNFLAK